jgi:TRAP-type mannitol/chloroaromatic compound transport system permease small subunit
VLIKTANALHRFLERVADASGWLLIVLMAVTCIDVAMRKFGVIGFPYTRAQELEWHLHTAIFSCWMGFNYVVNAHPRVDSYTDRLGFRRKAWIEFAGCLLFALPYTAVLLWYGWDFVRIAWQFNESSDAALGLPYRWIIKGVMYAGLWLLLLGIVSVLLRLIAYLFFKQDAKLNIGSSVSQV